MKKNRLFIMLFALLTFGQTAWAQWTGSGTPSDPYRINSTSDWELLCTNVNNGTSTYNGKFFVLKADLNVEETFTGTPTKQVGSSKDRSFQGYFEGNGHTINVNYVDNRGSGDICAPFRIIKDATIRNLRVTGYIYKNAGKHAGGIVGQSFGDVHLTNCRSSVDIHSNTNGDGSHGGIVGIVSCIYNQINNIYLDNCLFDGKLRTNGSRTKCWGGLIGWITDDHYEYHENTTDHTIEDPPCADFTNCLFAPTEVSINTSGSKTFIRYGGYRHFTNCYYTTLINDAQGNTNAANFEKETLCAALQGAWEIFEGAVAPIIGSHPLNGAGTVSSPFQIRNEDDWHAFASNVYLGEGYQGKYVKLYSVIRTSRMVGYYDEPAAHPNVPTIREFKGTFDGNGFTLYFERTFSAGDFNKDYCAPFRCIYGATIKNLVVEGSITTSHQFAAGLVAYANGSNSSMSTEHNTIENCRVSLSLISNVNGDGTHGGFIAINKKPYALDYASINNRIIGCIFDGKLLGPNTNSCGGFVGWTEVYNPVIPYISIINCMFAPSEITMQDTYSQTFARCSNYNYDPEIINSYYKMPFGGEQGKLRHRIKRGDYDVTIELAGTLTEYGVSRIMSNGSGMHHDGYLYGGAGDNISLNLSCRAPQNMICDYYMASAGTITGDSNPYTLAMPNSEVNITAHLIPKPWEGEGTRGDPYRIQYANQLDNLATYVNTGNRFENTYFKVVDNLYYSHTGTDGENNYTAIGGNLHPFQGHFDGNNKTIEGIRIHKDGNSDDVDSYQGLFGCIQGPAAEVKNVILSDAVITGYNYVGGIVGCNDKGPEDDFGSSITNCKVTNSVNIKAAQTGAGMHGGIVGANYSGVISHCTSSANLSMNSVSRDNMNYGGIAGLSSGGTLSDNFVIDAVLPMAGAKTSGAIIGGNYDGILIHNYYVNTEVWGAYTGIGCQDTDVTDNDGAIAGNIRNIEGYGDLDGRWAFIASPVTGNQDPLTVLNLIGEETALDVYDYDLFRYNPSAELEWENYIKYANNFKITNGKGYLYARQEDVVLDFNGTYNLDATKEVSLQDGWNLVGNPFPRAAYVDKPYYSLNKLGNSILINPTSEFISPCYGVVVEGQGANQSVTFSTTSFFQQSANNGGNLNITLTTAETVDRGYHPEALVIDNAIVSFNDGEQLGKFYFGDPSANIYLPQGDKEYAIAFSDKQGEVPVNFKANENDDYTITVNPVDVELSYLHLIDKLTGADIDLLAEPQYTFTAKTTDYESRFRLVFAANEADGTSTGSESFAFYSNGDLVILNEGEATLQVVDLIGRVIRTAELSQCGNRLTVTGIPAGVYVLRLIEGQNIKTQKMVIE